MLQKNIKKRKIYTYYMHAHTHTRTHTHTQPTHPIYMSNTQTTYPSLHIHQYMVLNLNQIKLNRKIFKCTAYLLNLCHCMYPICYITRYSI